VNVSLVLKTLEYISQCNMLVIVVPFIAQCRSDSVGPSCLYILVKVGVHTFCIVVACLETLAICSG